MTITFLWMDQRCTVEAPKAMADLLASLFPTLVDGAVPGTEPDLRITGEPDFVVNHGEPVRCAGLPEALAHAELAVTRHLLSSERRHCHLHGSAVMDGEGDAVLALGPSGSGKSSLAYAWHRMGLPLFGDDVVALDGDGLLHPFPRPLKVDAARLREAGEDPEATVGWDERAPDVWVVPPKGEGWAAPSPVRRVAGIRHTPGTEVRTSPLSGAERLRLLLDSVHRTGASKEESLDRLLRIADGASGCRIEFGDARGAARVLLEPADR